MGATAPAAPAKPEADPAKVAAMVAPIAKPAEPLKLPDAAPAAAAAALAADTKTAPTQPGAVQPDAMKPQAPKKTTKVIQKTKPTRRLQPGDLVCGECGEGNPPARKFCSRCGTSLATATTVKTKWWRKLIPKRKVKTLEAGARPGVGGVKGKKVRKPVMANLRRLLGFAAVAVTLLYTFVAPFRNWAYDSVIQPVKDKYHDLTTQDFNLVNVATSSASSEDPANPVGNAFDGHGNTFWASPGVFGEIVLTVTFAQPIDIDRAIVQNGSRDSFTSTSRPRNIHLVFDTNESFDLELKDNPEPQTHDINNAAGVSRIEIHIISNYAPENNPVVTLSEWEWFTEE